MRRTKPAENLLFVLSSSIKGKFSRIHFNELMLSAHAKWQIRIMMMALVHRGNYRMKMGFFAWLRWNLVFVKKNSIDFCLRRKCSLMIFSQNHMRFRQGICANYLFMRVTWIFRENTHGCRHEAAEIRQFGWVFPTVAIKTNKNQFAQLRAAGKYCLVSWSE